MAFRPEHEIYRRRFSRNLGVGVALGVFVALIFGLTVVKVSETGKLSAGNTMTPPGVGRGAAP